MRQFDAIIIGAGHNGLVSAAYLAKAGKSVLVLERREVPGGTLVTEEFDGFKADTLQSGTLRPDIIRDLDLPRFPGPPRSGAGGRHPGRTGAFPDGDAEASGRASAFGLLQTGRQGPAELPVS